jgi:hypothetical protein
MPVKTGEDDEETEVSRWPDRVPPEYRAEWLLHEPDGSVW